MDQTSINTYRTMAQVHTAISNATTLDGALREGLRIIAQNLGAENSVIWYAEPNDDQLRPYFWLGPNDLTTLRHDQDDGVVGTVYKTQEAVRMRSKAGSGSSRRARRSSTPSRSTAAGSSCRAPTTAPSS